MVHALMHINGALLIALVGVITKNCELEAKAPE